MVEARSSGGDEKGDEGDAVQQDDALAAIHKREMKSLRWKIWGLKTSETPDTQLHTQILGDAHIGGHPCEREISVSENT